MRINNKYSFLGFLIGIPLFFISLFHPKCKHFKFCLFIAMVAYLMLIISMISIVLDCIIVNDKKTMIYLENNMNDISYEKKNENDIMIGINKENEKDIVIVENIAMIL